MAAKPHTESPAEPWRSFLDDLDALLDQPADFHCIGGFAISQYFGFARETADLDVLSIAPLPMRTTIAAVAGEYARVAAVDRDQNLLTVERSDGARTTYDPRRLQGVTVHREADRVFSVGDRVQFTAPFKDGRVANRQLGTIEKIGAEESLRIRLDSGTAVEFRIQQHRHLDHGYAVTSHSGQGATADRVLVHVDSENANQRLVNTRLAYVAVSRARYDAQIYTNRAGDLGSRLGRMVSKEVAIDQANHETIESRSRDKESVRVPERSRTRSRELGMSR